MYNSFLGFVVDKCSKSEVGIECANSHYCSASDDQHETCAPFVSGSLRQLHRAYIMRNDRATLEN